jgi:hypothetical protein
VIWRSAIVAGYIALAILIGIAYGAQGLAILLFFYFWAGAWAVFLLVWGSAARAAGQWNFRRLDTAPPRPERTGSRPDEGERRRHPEAGVAGHAARDERAPATTLAPRPELGKLL